MPPLADPVANLPARSACDRKPSVRGAQSIDRAAGLLRLLASGQDAGTSLRDLVARSGLDRTTAYRMLSSLVAAGLAYRDPVSGLYGLGVEAMSVGLAALGRAPLTRACLPLMKALARHTGEHVFLVARAGDYSHCLHLEEGPRPIRAYAEYVGGARLLGTGVPSFSMLAQLDDAAISEHFERHRRQYEAQRLSMTKLLRWVKQARALGYAHISAQGVGGVGLAFGLGTTGTAALGIVAPAARMPRPRGAELVAAMRAQMRRFGVGDLS